MGRDAKAPWGNHRKLGEEHIFVPRQRLPALCGWAGLVQRKGLRSEFLENRGGIHVVKATAIVISGPKLGLGFPDWAERKENKQEKPSEGGVHVLPAGAGSNRRKLGRALRAGSLCPCPQPCSVASDLPLSSAGRSSQVIAPSSRLIHPLPQRPMCPSQGRLGSGTNARGRRKQTVFKLPFKCQALLLPTNLSHDL